ncbi:hypothetical protein OC834_007900, partial [Tilletia horrida]
MMKHTLTPSRIPQPHPPKAKPVTILRRTLRIGERIFLSLADGSTAVGLVKYASAHRSRPGSYAGIDLLPAPPKPAALTSSRRYTKNLGRTGTASTATPTTTTTTTTTRNEIRHSPLTQD